MPVVGLCLRQREEVASRDTKCQGKPKVEKISVVLSGQKSKSNSVCSGSFSSDISGVSANSETYFLISTLVLGS